MWISSLHSHYVIHRWSGDIIFLHKTLSVVFYYKFWTKKKTFRIHNVMSGLYMTFPTVKIHPTSSSQYKCITFSNGVSSCDLSHSFPGSGICSLFKVLVKYLGRGQDTVMSLWPLTPGRTILRECRWRGRYRVLLCTRPSRRSMPSGSFCNLKCKTRVRSVFKRESCLKKTLHHLLIIYY